MAVKKWIWRETAEVLGVIGVVASLIFVAFEIRQNTQVTRSTIIQDISRWSYDTTVLSVENSDLRAAIIAFCEGTANEDQRFQLQNYYSGLLRLQANRYYQTQLGLIDEATVFALGGTGNTYRRPMMREFWPDLKIALSSDFQAYFEQEILPLSRDSC